MVEENNDISEVRIDVALIKQDIKQIERFFDKVDQAVDTMSEVVKNLAVQQAIITNFESKLDSLSQRLGDVKQADLEGRLAINEAFNDYKEEFRDDMVREMDQAAKIHTQLAHDTKRWNELKNLENVRAIESIASRIEKTLENIDLLEKRTNNLEVVKWYILGGGAVGLFFLSNLDGFNSLFS